MKITLIFILIFVGSACSIDVENNHPRRRVVYFDCSLIDGKTNIAGENAWFEEHHLRSYGHLYDTTFVRLAIVRSDTDAIVFAVYADSTMDRVGRYKSVGCWWLPGKWKQKVCPEK